MWVELEQCMSYLTDNQKGCVTCCGIESRSPHVSLDQMWLATAHGYKLTVDGWTCIPSRREAQQALGLILVVRRRRMMQFTVTTNLVLNDTETIVRCLLNQLCWITSRIIGYDWYRSHLLTIISVLTQRNKCNFVHLQSLQFK